MGDSVTIPLESELARRIAERAREHGTTMEQEVKILLEEALRADWDRFLQEAQLIRCRLGDRSFGDSADLIREDRDR